MSCDPRSIAGKLRARFEEVVEALSNSGDIRVMRIMRVDRDWIDGLHDGSSTTGVYFGDDDMEQLPLR
jgi:hypothetical protein